jgi:hypothetical protein
MISNHPANRLLQPCRQRRNADSGELRNSGASFFCHSRRIAFHSDLTIADITRIFLCSSAPNLDPKYASIQPFDPVTRCSFERNEIAESKIYIPALAAN